MTEKSPRDVDSLKTSELLHPEVMDLKTISQILKQRGIEEPVTGRGQVQQSQTMEKALEMYHNAVLPKPQRVYKCNSRVGQRLLKKQNRAPPSPEKKTRVENSSQNNNSPAATKRPFPSDQKGHHQNQRNGTLNDPLAKRGRHANISWP